MMAFNLVTFFRNPSAAKQKTNPVNQRPVPPIVNHKPVLVSLDIDGTLIPWRNSETAFDQTAFLRYQHTLQEPALKRDSFMVINTGRGLKATKELAPFLARIPFDAIALNDGQQLFIKPKLNPQFHPIDANQQWIKRLTLKQTDPHWRKELGGWSTTRVLRDIREVLPEMEFKQQSAPHQISRDFEGHSAYVFTKQAELWKSAKTHYWAVKVDPDQAYMEIKRVGKKANAQEMAHYAKTLGRVLKYELQDEWPGISFQVITTPERCFLQVGPKNNSKATLVNYLANRRLTNQPKAIISAGDNSNDLPLLSAKHLGNIPNYPILVGENTDMKKALGKKPLPLLETVGWNQLHLGIEKQFQKIRPMIQSKAPLQRQETQSPILNQMG